jgi:anaerobic selenocysteine-containing dehydrogenase
VVQDIFLTETAWLADVVLPASAWPEKTGTVSNTDRTVQLGRRPLTPPGDARADLWIIQQMARASGSDWDYEDESNSPDGAGYHGVDCIRRNAPGHARRHRRHHLAAPAARRQPSPTPA